MNDQIFCRSKNDKLHFYVERNNRRQFLFSQSFYPVLKRIFQNGVYTYDIFKLQKNNNNDIVEHTVNRIISTIKYIEKEDEITILPNKQIKKVYKRPHSSEVRNQIEIDLIEAV